MTTKVEKTITVNVPISSAYNQWTQFEDFPQFMGGVQQVEQLDGMRLHWVAEIAGVKREWYATIVDQRPDEKVAWAATEGATNAGAVYFTSAGPDATSVTLELEYEPEGLVETVGDKLSIVDKQAQSDLGKFKEFIESRSVETGAWRGDPAMESGQHLLVQDVPGTMTGTPGVEAAAMSQEDDGKTGISGKAAAVAGVAAAAVGVAAAAAVRSGSSEETQTPTEAQPVTPIQTQPVTPVETELVTPIETVAPEVYVVPPVGLADDVPLETPPVIDDAGLADDSYGTTPASNDGLLADDVALDSTTPGITDENDGSR